VTYHFNYPTIEHIDSLLMQDYEFVLEVICHGIHHTC
jgi:hypothetical protein